jgi:Xaa-Pro aminopeptidase
VFLTDGRYRNQVIVEVKEFTVVISQGSLFEALKAKRLFGQGDRIGFESQHLTVSELKNLERLFPRLEFVPTVSLVEEIASVKEEQEIESLKQAASITDRVFQKVLGILEAGIREADVAAEISYFHRKLGAEADSFEPIVASGIRGALPHARASEKVIQKGEMVTLDFGCRYHGYHSDLTRTVAVGRPSAEMKKVYRIVLDAQQKAVDAAQKGMKAQTLDAIARRHIASKGYGKFFSHSLGHGLGRQVHELPRLSRLSKDILKERNVVTIEPGVYVPNLGGVRIEDDVVIRNGTCEVITHSPKSLLIV